LEIPEGKVGFETLQVLADTSEKSSTAGGRITGDA
jgi:hypothetical protein